MREIKFRAWHKVHSEWLSDPIISQYISIIAGEFITPTNVMLQQYTGLHDKNGKEIYEGDVVHWTHLPNIEPGIVTWVKAECCFAAEKKNGDPGAWLDEKCEVIGNIYENPELMK